MGEPAAHGWPPYIGGKTRCDCAREGAPMGLPCVGCRGRQPLRKDAISPVCFVGDGVLDVPMQQGWTQTNPRHFRIRPTRPALADGIRPYRVRCEGDGQWCRHCRATPAECFTRQELCRGGRAAPPRRRIGAGCRRAYPAFEAGCWQLQTFVHRLVLTDSAPPSMIIAAERRPPLPSFQHEYRKVSKRVSKCRHFETLMV